MRLYFLRNVRAEFAPKKEFKEGGVYDISLNNISTMLDNRFAIPESEKPKGEITLKKPQAAQAVQAVKKTRRRRTKKK